MKKIELKKVKVFEPMSQETYCFTAEVWIDGKKRATVSNEGFGGPNLMSPYEVEKELDEYGKTLPPIVDNEIRDPKDPSKMFSMSQDAETLIGDLITDYLLSKDLKKALKKKVLFTKKETVGIYEVKILSCPLERMRLNPKADKILNDLPFDEALKIYKTAI